MAEYMKHSVEEKERQFHERGCPAVAYQHVAVSVPVCVVPFAKAERIKIHCGGGNNVVQGETLCNGKKDGKCCFSLSQTFCVEVPVSFGARVEIGDTFVECLGASTSSAFVELEEDQPL
ncbi:MAG: hypothetical protein EOM50_03375 [Erysipelotrichia bacterium]|nr:hypothetical protein [Erysipelotrichia bacterium]NCC54883.1 hypothetical protein [Erysipelotrichia bacterium]